jgi:D-alanyl-D-alanine carboxypeptidase
MTTAGGRDVVFSIIVNGDEAGATQPAIDTVLARVAADAS